MRHFFFLKKRVLKKNPLYAYYKIWQNNLLFYENMQEHKIKTLGEDFQRRYGLAHSFFPLEGALQAFCRKLSF